MNTQSNHMTDVIIIGAGVVGASIALELQRSGRSVTVIDKGESVGGGSTSASSALIRFNYSTRSGVVAAWESFHRWNAWEEHLGYVNGPIAQFHPLSMLLLEPPGFDRSSYLKHFNELGIPFEELDEKSLSDNYPMFDTGRFWPPSLPNDDQFFNNSEGKLGGFFVPYGGFIDDPQLAAQNLMDAARHFGAKVSLRTSVVEIEKTKNKVSGVKLENGEVIESSIVINAAGPWSSHINDLAGVSELMEMSTKAMRQEVHAIPAPAEFNFTNTPVMIGDLDLGFYTRPQPGGTLIVGGVEADCDPVFWVEDPDDDSLNPTVESWEALVWRLAKRIPEASVPNRPTGLASHYDVTPDWTPIYDRTDLGGFYIACGTSGNQFKNAPLIGHLMNQLISACEAGHDHDNDPVQVLCPMVNEIVDLGTFSRNRKPVAGTGTVLG